MPQHAFLVASDGTLTDGLDDLNEALRRGARVVHATPMGGHLREGDGLLAALVVVEQGEEAQTEELVEEAEESLEQLLSEPDVVAETSEGNGAAQPEPPETP